ncbi:hypothetical protein GCM10027435_30270 [Haloparvum alkalitolerans]|uniref:DUF7331 family protein n=1 Tax=Haloparvum alkalitolerans TaxID=1042953 RepID=UPI003CF2DE87
MPTADAPTTDSEDRDEELPEITTACTSPDRTVFSERDNPDGWIATDYTVDLDE